jgi:hypothetical protein
MRKFSIACLVCSLALSCLLLAASREASHAAAQKIERISSESLRPGETVMLSQDELNSYLRYDYAPELPSGVRDLAVTLLQDRSVVEALVNFEKLPAVQDSMLATLGAKLFQGERKLLARCRFVSANGQGKVDIDSLELDGEPLPDFLVAWLISSTVQPHLTEFEAGKPFPLAKKMRQIRLEPARVVVIAY